MPSSYLQRIILFIGIFAALSVCTDTIDWHYQFQFTGYWVLFSLAIVIIVVLYISYRSIKRENQQSEQIAKEFQQHINELALHNLILQKISRNIGLTDLLNELARQIEKLHPKMLCSILLLDDRGILHHAASPSFPDAYKLAVDGLIASEGSGCCGTAAYRGERYIVDDIQQHSCCLAFHGLAKHMGVKSCWSQPIKNNQSKVLGIFAIYYSEIREPNATEIELIENYAVLAGIGIEKIQADTELHENEQRMRFVLKGSGIGFWDWKIDSHKVEVHTIDLEVFYYHCDEITAVVPRWLDFIYPADREKTWQSILAVLNGSLGSHQIEYRVLDNSGDIHWVLDKSSIVQYNSDGTPYRMSGTHTDITERKLFEHHLHVSEQRLLLCQQYGGVGTWEIDFVNQRQNWSPTACKLLGFSGLLNPEWSDFMDKVHADDWQTIINATQDHLERRVKYDVEYRIIVADQERWIRSVGSVDDSETDDTGKPRYFRGIVQDITERKIAEQQIEQLAFYDPLTQLPNRRLLDERLHRGINLALRMNEQLAVLMLDLDYFKTVNDSLGHKAGDRLLQQVAERVSKQVRKVDTVARLGGDEFVVLLTGAHQQHDVERVTLAIISELNRPFSLREIDNVQIGTSIGISFYPQHGDTPEALLDVADTALYQAKGRGRGCFCIAS